MKRAVLGALLLLAPLAQAQQLAAPVNLRIGNAPVQTTCVGTAITPSMSQATIQSKLTANSTSCWSAGTYHIAGYLQPSVGHKAICAQRRTCTLTGDDTNVGGWKVSAGVSNVTIKGFVVERFATPTSWPMGCMQARDGGLMEDNEIRFCYIGLTTESNTTTRGNYLHHNRHAGLTGGPSSNILIEGNEIAFNNTNHEDPGDDASGMKLVGSDGGTSVTFRNNYSHDNFGQGFWCDGNCKDSIVEGNRIENNTGAGIDWEISWNVIIRNNTLKGNMSSTLNGGKGCYDAQIVVNNSQGFEITGNTVESVGVNAICLSDTTRTERAVFPQFLTNANVHDNIVRMRGASMSGVVNERPVTGITWNRNQYFLDDLNAQRFQYGARQTRAQWQAAGRDVNSTFASW